MSNAAFWMMVITQVVVTGITTYFFFKVLKAPTKSETDSHEENDPS